MTSVLNQPGSLEGLPKQFVTSLRILYDILDEDRSGYVRFCDIESRWHEEGVKGLPSGVIEALRKVTPPNGYLTFEIFVSGLKLALLKTKTGAQMLGKENRGPGGLGESKTAAGSGRNQEFTPTAGHNQNPQSNRSRPTSSNVNNIARLQDARRSQAQGPGLHKPYSMQNTAAVRPNNVLNTLHQNSSDKPPRVHQSHEQLHKPRPESDNTRVYGSRDRMNPASDQPQMSHRRHGEDVYQSHKDVQQKQRPKSEVIYQSHDAIHRPPPRPDRPVKYSLESRSKSPPVVPPRNRNSRIMNELKNWHKEQTNLASNSTNKDPRFHSSNSDSKLMDKNRDSEIYANIEQIRLHEASKEHQQPAQKPGTVRRRDSRRHTLSSGVDYNMLKRMKQLEQEKDILLQGLEVVNQARDWYQRQLNILGDKQNMLGKTSYTDYTLEANQERMDFERARITEVNQHLCTLIDSTEKGFPLHMNLAIRPGGSVSDENTIKMLKEQNKMLTQEIGDKGDKISKLEQEKSSLIRELFDARSKNKNFDDTTFM